MARAIVNAVGRGSASGRALESLPPYGARYPDEACCGTAGSVFLSVCWTDTFTGPWL